MSSFPGIRAIRPEGRCQRRTAPHSRRRPPRRRLGGGRFRRDRPKLRELDSGRKLQPLRNHPDSLRLRGRDRLLRHGDAACAQREIGPGRRRNAAVVWTGRTLRKGGGRSSAPDPADNRHRSTPLLSAIWRSFWRTKEVSGSRTCGLPGREGGPRPCIVRRRDDGAVVREVDHDVLPRAPDLWYNSGQGSGGDVAPFENEASSE